MSNTFKMNALMNALNAPSNSNMIVRNTTRKNNNMKNGFLDVLTESTKNTKNTQNAATKRVRKSAKNVRARLDVSNAAKKTVNRASVNMIRAARMASRRAMTPANVANFKALKAIGGPSNTGNARQRKA